MAQIKVTAPFRLNLDDGTFREFAPGVHELEDEIADHWYVKANSQRLESAQPETPPPTPVTPEKQDPVTDDNEQTANETGDEQPPANEANDEQPASTGGKKSKKSK